jgi:hypothetical protein
MPMCSFFAMAFFFFRYYIEKYNMMFVYQQDFESRGHLRDILIPYQIFEVILYQLMNFAFLSSLGTDKNLLIGGYSFVIF